MFYECKFCTSSVNRIINCFSNEIVISPNNKIECIYTFYRDIEILQELNRNLYNNSFHYIPSSIVKIHPSKTLILNTIAEPPVEQVIESTPEPIMDPIIEPISEQVIVPIIEPIVAQQNIFNYYEKEIISDECFMLIPCIANLNIYDIKNLSNGKIIFTKNTLNDVE